MSSYTRIIIKERQDKVNEKSIKLKMSKRKANQNVSKIIADLSEGRYSLKRISEGERDPSRLCRIKKLFKKLKRAKGELIEDRMILFFELGKELGDDNIYVGEKNDRLCARRVYKSFEKSYPWIPIGKNWKMRYFSRINVKDAEEIACNWISTELNTVEGENMCHDQSLLTEAQQSDQPELQITLQEVIGMIDSTAHEKTIGDDVRHEETIGDDVRHEETIGDDVRREETRGDDVRREETMTDEMQQWFDWVI